MFCLSVSFRTTETGEAFYWSDVSVTKGRWREGCWFGLHCRGLRLCSGCALKKKKKKTTTTWTAGKINSSVQCSSLTSSSSPVIIAAPKGFFTPSCRFQLKQSAWNSAENSRRQHLTFAVVWVAFAKSSTPSCFEESFNLLKKWNYHKSQTSWAWMWW